MLMLLLLASLFPRARQKSVAITFNFLLGLTTGATAFWFATVIFHWLDRTPTWWLSVWLVFIFFVFNYERVSRLVHMPDAIHEAVQGIGDCLGVILGAMIFL